MLRLTAGLLATALLAGCAGPGSPAGTWINQPAIDAAAAGGPLREALLAYGPTLEWQLDPQQARARYSDGMNTAEGRLEPLDGRLWQVRLGADASEQLRLDGRQLLQLASPHSPEQGFRRSPQQAHEGEPVGRHFEHALYAAYLGGTWRIEQGPGRGGLVHFAADGQLQGLGTAERYALCLAGDCASMTREHDSLWLQQGQHGAIWLFQRDGNRLRILEAVNRAAVDAFPDYRPGRLAWLLQRD